MDAGCRVAREYGEASRIGFAIPTTAVRALIEARRGDALAVVKRGMLGIQLTPNENDGGRVVEIDHRGGQDRLPDRDLLELALLRDGLVRPSCRGLRALDGREPVGVDPQDEPEDLAHGPPTTPPRRSRHILITGLVRSPRSPGADERGRTCEEAG